MWDSYVYQSHLGGIDSAILDRLCEDFVSPFYPDHSYFIHVSSQTALKRIEERGIENRNDDISFEEVAKLSDAYLLQSKMRENITLIENNNALSEALNILLEDIKKRISLI